MKILLVHNFYQQAGGEDTVFRAEEAMLRANGHAVTTYTVSNDAIEEQPKVRSALDTLWNAQAGRELGLT